MRIQPALFVLLAAGTGLVTGCRQAPATAADFNGAWRGGAQFLNSTGRGNSVHEWSIDADPTGRMLVAVTWSMSADDNTHGYDFGGEAVKGDTEQLLGLIDYETGEFVAVETEGTHTTGATVTYLNPVLRAAWAKREPNADVALTVESEAFEALFAERVIAPLAAALATPRAAR